MAESGSNAPRCRHPAGPRDPGDATRRRVRSTSRRRPAEASCSAWASAWSSSTPHYDIVRINAAARRVLGIHGTAFDQDFIHLADALPSTAIRTAIDGARRARRAPPSTRSRPPSVASDAPRHIEATIRPYQARGAGVDGAVIELTDVTRSSANAPATRARGSGWTRRRRRNERLLRANDELTALIAELRAANRAMLRSSEDAQAGREEVETLNEEFQATNEELETLNEELTASVEELRIANEDLAPRTEELRLKAVAIEEQKRETEEEHDRLGSILASIGDAVVAVDHDGRTVATNLVYDRLFGGPTGEIRPEDVAGLPFRRGLGRSSGRPAVSASGSSSRSATRTGTAAGSRPSRNR